jgi:hypothetical protein
MPNALLLRLFGLAIMTIVGRSVVLFGVVEIRKWISYVFEDNLGRYLAKLEIVNSDGANKLGKWQRLKPFMYEVSDCFCQCLAIWAACQSLPVDVDRHLRR